jgi:hypothetical protein
MLDAKERLFDVYARRSALAEEVAGTVDVSEARLARAIVAAERARLVVDPARLDMKPGDRAPSVAP